MTKVILIAVKKCFPDDFDLSEQAVEHSIEENIPSDESTSKELAPIEESSFAKESSSESSSKETVEDIPETNGVGGVAEFRKTLSNLSRQLEIDRLAFLHQSMKDCGEKLPTLSQIAADIQGTKPLAAKGDCDQYGGRPTARLEGWVSGLSFWCRTAPKNLISRNFCLSLNNLR